ncbi:hypothetical protein O181_023454 [Austropuccinia psidii MF-1]|uniref:Reverse transcriptase Ty1/copia-type domain-containing protein n=1 Tax=Austropuccinia psidii MF-1 TaxID=1389203 RepID=A0A9Q3CGQ5_9BASI|nr:hypothetical protein [Austropuccinia psidii MF-1]
MSTEATENPYNTLNRQQNYARHLESKQKVHKEEQLSTELVSSSSNHPSRLVYYCANGKREKDEKSNCSPSTAYALMTFSSESSCEIFIDSAATHHMFNDESLFINLEQFTSFVISTGDPESNLCAEGRGPINLHISGKLLRFANCLYVPCISHNLISMIQLLEESIIIEKLLKGRFKVVMNHDTAITGQFINGLIFVNNAEPKALISISDVWHHRLGHPSNQAVKTLGLPPFSSMCKICMLEINKEDKDMFCDCKDIEPKGVNNLNVPCHSIDSPPTEQASQIPEDLDLCYPENHRRIKVIVLQNPTLIQGDINSENIFPYLRRPKAFVASSTVDPASYSKAVSGSESSFWLDAIRKELNTMKKLEVWNVLPLKRNFRLVGTTWVFKRKRNDLNVVTEYKARLCAQGFLQTLGQDYSKTFEPTGHLHSLQMLIAFSVENRLDFQQLNI